MAAPIPAIPLDALAVDFLQAGGLSQFLPGWVHAKVVPYSIVIEVLQGFYEVDRGPAHTRVNPGEIFMSGPNIGLRFVHCADPVTGAPMAARWIHFRLTLFGAVDFCTLFDLPIKIGAAERTAHGGSAANDPAQAVRDVIGEMIGVDADGACDPLLAATRRLCAAYRLAVLIQEVAPFRPGGEALARDSGRLAAVFEYIRGRLDRPIMAGELARVAHMSLSNFYEVFHRHLGQSPMDYVKSLRLAEACKLLNLTEEPIGTIAQRVGFANQFHFAREFKIRFSTPPTVYRRIHRQLGQTKLASRPTLTA